MRFFFLSIIFFFPAFLLAQNEATESRFVLDKSLPGHSAGVQNLRFSPDGKWIASASIDKTIIIWDVQTGILRHRLRKHQANIYEVTFNKKGTLLASASEDGTACLWDARYGKLLGQYENLPLMPSTGLILRSVSFATFSPDDKYLFFGGDNGYIMKVRIDITNQVPVAIFSINDDTKLYSNTITGGTIAPSEKEIIFSADHYIYAISLQNNKLIRRFHHPEADLNDVVKGANKNEITAWAYDGTLVTWNYYSSQKTNVLKVSPKENYSAASFSSEGTLAVTAANGTKATVWNWNTQKAIASLDNHRRTVRVARFSPTEKLIATASLDGRVRIWKEETLENKIILKKEKAIHSNTDFITNNNPSSDCDTVFVDRIVEKVIDKIVYVRDTVWLRDTVIQKVFVRNKSQKNQPTAQQNFEREDAGNSTKKVSDHSQNAQMEEEKILTTDTETEENSIENDLEPQLEVGKTLNLKNIQFEQGTSKLLESAYSDLEKLLGIMKKYPQMKIRLGGHTDAVGIQTVNLRLSGERVRTVQNYLVQHGISRARIQTRAYGGAYPIASNSSEATRKLNRRVEVTILSK